MKNNYKQEKYIVDFGAVNTARYAAWVSSEPSKLCLFPHSQSGLASNKVLSFWLSGSLFTGNEDTAAAAVNVLSLCNLALL